MNLFIPTMYQKNIYNINYNKLKENGIKCLIFDLDNTIALIDEDICPEKTKKLIASLNKNFNVFIISNNTYNRIKPYQECLNITVIANALKPSTKALKKIRKEHNYSLNEMCLIGDQLMTDILAGNRFQIKTVLVDPLGTKDLKITLFNRFLEKIILKKLAKKKVLERGKYYG